MVLRDNNPSGEENTWDTLKQEIHSEIEQTKRELQEIVLMFEQSQLEVNRLVQKNAYVTTELQRLRGHFDSVPREDIRAVYDGALDSQQRLFVMRGPSEK